MTGGSVLPADTSPPPAPDDAGTGSVPSPGQEPGAAGSAGTLPGLPRLYFAEQPEAGQLAGGTSGPAFGGQAARGPGGSGGTDGPGGLDEPRSPEPWPAARQAQDRQPARQRPSRPRPTRPPGRELKQRAIASLVFGILSLVALLGLGTDLRRGVYLLIFSALLGLAAFVIGITAVVKARRTGTLRPRGAVGGIVLGAIAALLSIPILATYLAYPTQVNQYVQCLSQAQTSADRQACVQQFYKTTHLHAPGVASAVPWVAGHPAGRDHGSADGPPGRRGGSSSAG